MKEIWKPINNYEQYYEVSNIGRVRSVGRYITRSDGKIFFRQSIIKKQTFNQDGYLTVKLSKHGIDKRIGVHILVAQAFVDGHKENYEVNHINFDRSDNNESNLEWVSHSDNIKHTINAGRHICCTDVSGSNNPNYGNHILSEKYLDKELAKEKQSRPGKINGRATPVEMSDGHNTKRFDYFGECARYMIQNNLCKSKSVAYVSVYISKAAKSGSNYSGLSFKLV